MNIKNLVRPNIQALKAYSSARDEFDAQGEEVLLDANENPFESAYNRYPDPYQRELKQIIANLKGISPDQLFVGNGSDEAIDLIFRIFCEPGKDKVIIHDPTYGMYEVSAAIQNIEVVKIPLNTDFTLNAKALLDAADNQTKVLFICNPNNPTGNVFDPVDLIYLIQNFAGIVVIDEAYADFAKFSLVKKINDFNNLIILQTLSKAWGMAGIRLGMAFTNPEIMTYFNKTKAPYNLSILTQKVAGNILKENQATYNEQVARLIENRLALETALKKLKIVKKVHPSQTNFLLVEFKNHQQVFELLKEEKVIVRDRSKATHCEHTLRITIGTEAENNRIIEILNNI